MFGYFKSEIVSRQLVAMIIKSVLAIAFVMFTHNEYSNIAISLMIFLTCYSLCSLVQFCVKTTGNYIVALVMLVGSMILSNFLILKLDQMIGNSIISSISVILCFIYPIIFDIVKLIKIIKIKE